MSLYRICLSTHDDFHLAFISSSFRVLTATFAFTQDVTEAAQHDRAVAAMANELRQLVDTANAPIFGIDVNVSLSFYFQEKIGLATFLALEACGRYCLTGPPN